MRKQTLLLIVFSLMSVSMIGQKEVELGKKGLKELNNQNYDKALKYFDKVLKDSPTNLNALYYSGVSYEKKKDYKKAIQFYTKCANLKEFPEVYKRRGTCYFYIKEDSLSILDLNKSLKLKPDDDEAVMQRASAYRRTGQYEKLLKDLNNHLAKVPNDFFSKANRAITLNMLERHEDALNQYKELLKEKPNEYRLYNGIADTYLKMDKLDLAIKNINKALEINDKYAKGYVTKAEILLKMNKNKEACKELDKAVKFGVDSNNETVKRILDTCNE